jgi:hypothetical protein
MAGDVVTITKHPLRLYPYLSVFIVNKSDTLKIELS